MVGRLLFGRASGFQRRDLLVERGDRVFGTRQRRFLCSESAGECCAAFDEGRADKMQNFGSRYRRL